MQCAVHSVLRFNVYLLVTSGEHTEAHAKLIEHDLFPAPDVLPPSHQTNSTPSGNDAADLYRLSQIVPESQATFRIASAVPRPTTARVIQVSTASREPARPSTLPAPNSEVLQRSTDHEAARSANISPDLPTDRPALSPEPDARHRVINVSPLSDSSRHISAIVNKPEDAFSIATMSQSNFALTQRSPTALPDILERGRVPITPQGAYGPFLIWCVEYKKGLYWKIEELPDNTCVLAATTNKQKASFIYLYPYDKGEDNETFRIGYHRSTGEYYNEDFVKSEELNGGQYVVEVDEPAACFLCAKSNTRWKNHLSMEYDSSNFHEFLVKLLAVPSVNSKFISSKQLQQGGTFFVTAQSHSGQMGYVWIRRNTRNADADTPDTTQTTYQSGCKTSLDRYRGNRHTVEYMHFKLLPVRKAQHIVLRGTH